MKEWAHQILFLFFRVRFWMLLEIQGKTCNFVLLFLANSSTDLFLDL